MFGTELHALDWLVIAAYLVGVLCIGIYFTRRASRSTGDYFLAGRSLPWWIAGTSIVATTFSSDTPLQVVDIVRKEGIWGNWWWWSMAIGHMICTFVFAPLWARSGLTTDVEFIALRYEGTEAKILRGFGAIYQGVFVNAYVVAAVTLGMATIVAVMLNIDADAVTNLGLFEMRTTLLIVIALAVITIAYSLLSGLYGVAYSDFLQFAVAMIGAVVLAWIVIAQHGGMASLMDEVRASPAYKPSQMSISPRANISGVAMFTFIIYFTVNWWSRVPGHGALAQRLLACRSERDSVLSMLWFNISHYCLRPWPWIVIGVASVAVFPNLADGQAAYPMMIAKFMPIGVKGLLVVAMLSAYMSTVDSHVNLAASYLVNDLYKPAAPRRTERHYVLMGRLAMIAVLIVVVMIAAQLSNIVAIYKYLGVIMSGTALVLVLRWMWWRINAWSEIAAMASALVVGTITYQIPALNERINGADAYFGHRLLITTFITAIVWLTVTYLTKPVSRAKLEAFCQRVRPISVGWRPIWQPDVRATRREIMRDITQILLGIAMIMSTIMLGWELLFGSLVPALTWLLVTIVSTVWLLLTLRGDGAAKFAGR